MAGGGEEEEKAQLPRTHSIFAEDFDHYKNFGNLLNITPSITPEGGRNETKRGEYVNGVTGETLSDGLRNAVFFHGEEEKEKRKHPIQLNVPVYMTFLLKKFVQIDSSRVDMVGTLIQRPLFVDLRKFEDDEEKGKPRKPYFEMRINDAVAPDGAFVPRKTTTDYGGKEEEYDFSNAFFSATTFMATIPMETQGVFSAHPFHIVKCTSLIELTSVTAKLLPDFRPPSENKDQEFVLRPDLVFHVEDKRNLISVKYWDDLYQLDQMRDFDTIHTSPDVSFIMDYKEGKSTYVPKMHLSWYFKRDAVKNFMETFFPIIFAAFASTVNVLMLQKGLLEVGDFFANVIALALTVVFIIPQLNMTDSLHESSFFTLNNLYISLVFVALIVSIFAVNFHYNIDGSDDDDDNNLVVDVMVYVSIVVTFSPIFIPLWNLIRFKLLLHEIWDCYPHKDDKCTYNGRPGKINKAGAAIEFSKLRKFYKQNVQTKQEDGGEANNVETKQGDGGGAKLTFTVDLKDNDDYGGHKLSENETTPNRLSHASGPLPKCFAACLEDTGFREEIKVRMCHKNADVKLGTKIEQIVMKKTEDGGDEERKIFVYEELPPEVPHPPTRCCPTPAFN